MNPAPLAPIAHSANPLPLWMHAAPIGTAGYSWFPAAMIALLFIMFMLIFFYNPGSAGEPPASDVHRDR